MSGASSRWGESAKRSPRMTRAGLLLRFACVVNGLLRRRLRPRELRGCDLSHTAQRESSPPRCVSSAGGRRPSNGRRRLVFAIATGDDSCMRLSLLLVIGGAALVIAGFLSGDRQDPEARAQRAAEGEACRRLEAWATVYALRPGEAPESCSARERDGVYRAVLGYFQPRPYGDAFSAEVVASESELDARGLPTIWCVRRLWRSPDVPIVENDCGEPWTDWRQPAVD